MLPAINKPGNWRLARWAAVLLFVGLAAAVLPTIWQVKRQAAALAALQAVEGVDVHEWSNPPRNSLAKWSHNRLPENLRKLLESKSYSVQWSELNDADGQLLSNLVWLYDVEHVGFWGGQLPVDALKHLAPLTTTIGSIMICPEVPSDVDPTDLAQLTNLRDLVLENVKFSASIGKAWDNLSQLERLSIQLAEPAELDLASLVHLTSLQELELKNVRLTDHANVGWAKHENLNKLSVRFSEPTDLDPSFLETLPGIIDLSLENLRLSNPSAPPWRGVKGLWRLHFVFSETTELAPSSLAIAKSKDSLSLDNIRLTKSLGAALGKLEQLQSLSILLGESAEAELGFIGNLEELRCLGLRNVQPGSLRAVPWKKLKYLANVKIELAEPAALDLSFLAQLEPNENFVLRLGNVHFTDEGAAQLAKYEWISKLALVNCLMNDQQLDRLGHIKQLDQLDLSGTKVTGSGLRSLHFDDQFARVEVDLSNTAFSDDSVEYLRGKWISCLGLNHTQLTDSGLARLADLIEQKGFGDADPGVIELRGTKVTDAGVRDFRARLPGYRVEFRRGCPCRQ